MKPQPFPEHATPPGNPPCTCDNCGKTYPINQLAPINTRTFWQRVQPGAVIPAGDCPDCGAFAYLDPVPYTSADAADDVLEMLKRSGFTSISDADLWESYHQGCLHAAHESRPVSASFTETQKLVMQKILEGVLAPQ